MSNILGTELAPYEPSRAEVEGLQLELNPSWAELNSVATLIHTYRTGANNGRSWIGAALEYRPQFLDQKIFFCIKASLNHKPQKILNSGT